MRSGKYYRGLKVNGKKKDYHRYIMEVEIGRELSSQEIVHHIDGDKQNNDISNLMVMPLKEHARLHSSGIPCLERTKEILRNLYAGRARYEFRKLTDEQVNDVLKMRERGMSLRQIGSAFGVHHTTVLKYLKRAN